MFKIFERFLLVLAICLLAGNAQAEAFRIMVLGDSLTSGYDLQPDETYAGKLKRKLQEVGYQNIEVIDMSSPNITTTEMVEKLPQIRAKSPDIVVLELGANDALHGISTVLMQNNLDKIMDELQPERNFFVLLGIKSIPGINLGYAQQMQRVYGSLAEKWAVHFYPDVLDNITGNPEHTLADGYHPNAKGIDYIVENTYRMVDTGLRYKWSVMQYQQYQQQYQNSTIPHVDMQQTPPNAIPTPPAPKPDEDQ